MCKLCNTNRPSYVPRRPMVQETLLEFIDIVKDYTNEIPCRRCIDNYSRSYRRYGIQPDTYIIKSTLRSHSKHFSVKERKSAASILNKPADRYEIRVGVDIRKVVNNDSGLVVYRVSKSVNMQTVTKSFNTLSEAIEFRDKLYLVPSTRFKPSFVPIITYVARGIHSKKIDTANGVIVRYKVTWRSNDTSKCKIVDTLKEAKQIRKERP